MNIVNKVLKGIIIILGLNMCYLLFLMGTYNLPIESIRSNVEKSMEIWGNNREYEYPVYENQTVYFDNISDMIWANMATVKGDNCLKSAVALDYYIKTDGGDQFDDLVAAIYYTDESPLVSYSRYWNINVGFLKLLFTFLNLSDIRFLFYQVITILMIVLCYKLYKAIGLRGSIPIIMAFLITSLNWHAMSLSFIGDIILTIVSLIVITYLHKRSNTKKLYYLFLIMGSLSFALGPLVTPVLSVGMSLICCVQLEQNANTKFESWKRLFLRTVLWIAGYGATMLFKQLLSRIIIGSQNGTSTALNWFGLDMGLPERIELIGKKVIRLFTPFSIKIPMCVILIILLTVLCIRYYKKGIANLQLVFLSMYPFLWMLVVSKHTIHSFTSHLLAITVYGSLSLTMNHIDIEKIGKTHKAENIEANKNE